jgi:hypothetical protein
MDFDLCMNFIRKVNQEHRRNAILHRDHSHLVRPVLKLVRNRIAIGGQHGFDNRQELALAGVAYHPCLLSSLYQRAYAKSGFLEENDRNPWERNLHTRAGTLSNLRPSVITSFCGTPHIR